VYVWIDECFQVFPGACCCSDIRPAAAVHTQLLAVPAFGRATWHILHAHAAVRVSSSIKIPVLSLEEPFGGMWPMLAGILTVLLLSRTQLSATAASNASVAIGSVLKLCLSLRSCGRMLEYATCCMAGGRGS
jgi:hypothetical protein